MSPSYWLWVILSTPLNWFHASIFPYHGVIQWIAASCCPIIGDYWHVYKLMSNQWPPFLHILTFRCVALISWHHSRRPCLSWLVKIPWSILSCESHLNRSLLIWMICLFLHVFSLVLLYAHYISAFILIQNCTYKNSIIFTVTDKPFPVSMINLTHFQPSFCHIILSRSPHFSQIFIL